MNEPNGNVKRRRKAARAQRRAHGMRDYRNDCRAQIAAMRQHNEHATSGEDRYKPQDFRAALKRLRYEFSRYIAGKPAKARAA